jgi:hypothetical protein
MALVTGGGIAGLYVSKNSPGPAGELSLPLLRQPPRPIALQRATSKHTPSTTTTPETPPNCCPLATPCYPAQPTTPAPHLLNSPGCRGKAHAIAIAIAGPPTPTRPIPPSALPACSTPGSMSASCHPSPRTQGLLCPRI